jgi:hypothetical protein
VPVAPVGPVPPAVPVGPTMPLLSARMAIVLTTKVPVVSLSTGELSPALVRKTCPPIAPKPPASVLSVVQPAAAIVSDPFTASVRIIASTSVFASVAV